MASKPEFIYFCGRGRGEIIRLTLMAAGIEFTEKNIYTREEFLALQHDLLFNQIPLLRIDGQNLVQTSAIVRYVARKGHLLGEKEPDIVKIDMLYEGSRDYFNLLASIGFGLDEANVGEKKPAIDRCLAVFNKVLEENGTGYLVGSKLTLADVGVLEALLATIDYFGQDVLHDYPAVQKFHKTVTALEAIKKYIKDVRKPRNDDVYVNTVKKVLGWV